MSNDEGSPWDPCATISTFLSLSDISKASSDIFSELEVPSATPVLHLLAALKAKGYESICMPLTNAGWKKRWEDMCTLSAESTEGEKQKVAREAEAWRMMPGFKKDEVTITRLGVSFCAFCSMPIHELACR
jgi:protein arginine N-methyltransferase 5